jgi:D-aspartate ligase
VNLATRSIPVYVLNEPWEEARFSRYVRAIRLRANGPYPQSAMDFLTGNASNHLKGSVLLAGGDEELEIMAKKREALAGRFRLDLSNPVAQLTMLDKLATYSAAKEGGVTTPRFWQVQSEEDIHRLRDERVYPLIVKPKVSHVFQKKFKAKFFVAESFDQLLEAAYFAFDAVFK